MNGPATQPEAGLTAVEAAALLAERGPNEVSARPGRTLVSTVLEIVREPMALLLLGCGAIYLVLGERQESLMLLGFVAFIQGITLFQEHKTEGALAALRDLTSPRALVIRDGTRIRIPGREVVVGDLVVLSEGDRVPADVTILASSHLSVDESLLSGESAPVRKSVWDGYLSVGRPGGQDAPFAFAGTLVVEGSAITRVHATGRDAEIGRIGAALRTPAIAETALQRETRRLVGRLAWAGGGLSLLVVLVLWLGRGHPLEGVLAGLTLAMAILPNEFPVVVAIFLALGAFRLSKRRVLTRRLPAIESIGAATVLCVDKTGTLTQNRMEIQELLVDGATFEVSRLADEPLPEAFHEVVEYSILASRRDPFDPMERAFKSLGERHLAGTEHLHDDWELVREYPLSREVLAVTRVWRPPSSPALVVAMKGAPECVAERCHLDAGARQALKEQSDQLARAGLRVLAVARAELQGGALPASARAFDLALVGLVGLADPVREDVPRAIAKCRSAGIRVVMITGDYPETALSVARSIGLDGPDSIMTGAELASLGRSALRERVRRIEIFARVLPEQKLEIVEALKAAGEVVAMTGDGVNDAPAIRAANIGVAMGGRGTDVAREASAIVLLDDDFASLVEAVRSGRRIMDNLRKALTYILAVHLPIVGLTLVPIFFGWPLVLLPIHIAFLHLVIDPACSVIFEAEAEEPDIMHRPPREPDAPLFGRRALSTSLVQGAVVSAVVLAVFAGALHHGLDEARSRTLTFGTFMVANLGLIFTNRSWSGAAMRLTPSGNPTLAWLSVTVPVFLAAAIYVPVLERLFRFEPLPPIEVALAIVAGALSVGWFEVFKCWRDRTQPGPGDGSEGVPSPRPGPAR